MPLGKSGPLERLRHLAIRTLRSEAHWAFGITFDDLVSAGWLAYHAALPHAKTETYPFERARFAMLDEIRRWYDLEPNGKWQARRFTAWELREPASGTIWVGRGLSSHTPKPGFGWVRLSDKVARSPDGDAPRLTKDLQEDFKAACLRLLSASQAELMIGLVIEEESLEVMADRLKKSRNAVAVYRSKSIRTLLDHLAA